MSVPYFCFTLVSVTLHLSPAGTHTFSNNRRVRVQGQPLDSLYRTLAYVKAGLLNLDRSLKQPTAKHRAAQNLLRGLSKKNRHIYTLPCRLRHIPYIKIYTLRYICKSIHAGKGYSVHSAKRMTSFEPFGGCRLNEKQTGRERDDGRRKAKCHMRVCHAY